MYKVSYDMVSHTTRPSKKQLINSPPSTTLWPHSPAISPTVSIQARLILRTRLSESGLGPPLH